MTIGPNVSRGAECGACNHYPAYHDGDGGRPCRAWNPDQPDAKCACKGWEAPPPKPEPTTTPAGDYEEPWADTV